MKLKTQSVQVKLQNRPPVGTPICGLFQYEAAIVSDMWNQIEDYDPSWGFRLNLSAGIKPGTSRDIIVRAVLIDPGSRGIANSQSNESIAVPCFLGAAELVLQPR
jgi:hypothetical protein